MPSINLRDVGVLSPHPLFQNLTMTIGDTDRIGLIAGNGGGKTTLLRCLAGLAEPTTGDIVRSRGMRVGYVEQDVPENLLNLPLAEAIRRALPPAERDSDEWRVDVVLDEFGAPADLHDRPLARAERRLAAAGADRARLGDRAGRAAARRADQPSGSREDPDAGTLDRRVPCADGDRQPRPALPRCLHDADAVPAARRVASLRASLHAGAASAGRGRCGTGGEAREGDARGGPAAPQRQ